MCWAYQQPVPDAESKLILLALANYAGHDNQCWPSIKRIARECLLSERTVQYRLQMLSEAKILTIKPRTSEDGGPASNIFCLNFAPPGAGDAPPSRTAATTPGAPRAPKPVSTEPVNEPNTLYEFAKSKLSCAFHRDKDDPWDYSDEYALLDLSRRPKFLSELDEILELKEEAEKPPRSIRSVLDGWTKFLDQSRNMPELEEAEGPDGPNI